MKPTPTQASQRISLPPLVADLTRSFMPSLS
jgi:hypothetical protein